LTKLEALLEATYGKPEWKCIFKSTAGIVFFATPFLGWSLLRSELLASARDKYGEDQVKGAVLDILVPNNEALSELVDKYRRAISQDGTPPLVTCIYETKVSNIGAIFDAKPLFVGPANLSVKCALG
jgi:hypothetical protein